MTKFTWILIVAFCFPIVGLTGCGRGSETRVIEDVAVEDPGDADAEMEAGMAEMDVQTGQPSQ